MGKIKLITDSTCDLSQELIEKNNIHVVPLYVSFGEQEYEDGITLTTEKMYDLVDELDMLPKSSAVAPGVFVEVFTKYLDEGYEIIYCGIGSKFSGTFNSAVVARNMLDGDRIHLVDSSNLSSGSGLLLLKGGRFIRDGHTALEVKTMMEALVPKVRSQFVINTLDYLYKGGRLNALSAFMGRVLRIHPIIQVVDGAMIVGKKVRGSMNKAILEMVNDARVIKEDIDPEFMMITHSIATETYPMVRKEVEDDFNIENIHETHAGCVISTHCGKGTIGILYIMK